MIHSLPRTAVHSCGGQREPQGGGVGVTEWGRLISRGKAAFWHLKQSLSWVVFMNAFIHPLNKLLLIDHVLPAKPCARVVWEAGTVPVRKRLTLSWGMQANSQVTLAVEGYGAEPRVPAWVEIRAPTRKLDSWQMTSPFWVSISLLIKKKKDKNGTDLIKLL